MELFDCGRAARCMGLGRCMSVCRGQGRGMAQETGEGTPRSNGMKIWLVNPCRKIKILAKNHEEIYDSKN